MKKMMLSIFCLLVVIHLVIPNCFAFSNETINSNIREQPNLQYSIKTNIDTIKFIFQFIIVTVNIKNLENESVILEMGGYPGGRFFIIDEDGKSINTCPKLFLLLLWELTLEPKEEYTLYQGIWFQQKKNGQLVRNGEYYIFGETGIISFNGTRITPDPFGPVNITIARRFIH
jgi:hypothetical protein